MPTNTRWMGISVLISFNLVVLCLSRPIAELIGWGWNSFIANVLVTAPLFALSFLAMIMSRSLLTRALMVTGCLFITSVVESVMGECRHVDLPDLCFMEANASELFLVLGPVCVLIYLVTGFVDMSLASHNETRTRDRNRLSIGGLMIGMTVLFVAIVWKSHVGSRQVIASISDFPRVDVERDLAEIRVRNAASLAIFAPLLSSLLLCGWWAGISRVRCLVLFVFAVALGTISRSPGTSRVLMGAAGFSLWTTHIALNVFATKLFQQQCEEKENVPKSEKSRPATNVEPPEASQRERAPRE